MNNVAQPGPRDPDSITAQLGGEWPGARIYDFTASGDSGPPQYQPPSSIGERATIAMERQAAALESIAVSLERLADEHGTPPDPTPEDIARHQEQVRWLGR